MATKEKKRSIFARIRNYFIAGVVVLIPIGITIYLTVFFVSISSKILPKGINPNHYLPYNIPGLEILISLILITFIGWLSLSFIGKKLLDLFNSFLKKIPILRTIYSAIGQMTETFTSSKNNKKNVVLVEYPRKGTWAVGFATKDNSGEISDKTKKDLINVFVPTTPNPTSGFLLMFPEDERVAKVKAAMFDPFEYLMLRHKANSLHTEFINSLGKVLHHAACHQRVQNIGPKTKEFFQLIPGTTVQSIERCSGHDGTYAVKVECHDISRKICRPIIRKLEDSGPDHYMSDCPLAGEHIAAGARSPRRVHTATPASRRARSTAKQTTASAASRNNAFPNMNYASTEQGFATVNIKEKNASKNAATKLDYSGLVGDLRATFNSGLTKDLAWRKQQLRQLQAAIAENTDAITAAVRADHRGPKVRHHHPAFHHDIIPCSVRS